MTTAPIPTSAAPEPTGAMGRIIGAFFSPKQTFASIVIRPTWIVPVILNCCFFIAIVGVFTQRGGWPSFFEKQNANNSRIQQMSAEDREKVISSQLKYAPPFGYVEGVFLPPLVTLAVAGVLLGAFTLVGAKTNFRTSRGIVAYAWVPWLIQGLLSILILFLRDPSTVDLQNLVASNPGAFLADDAPKWLAAFLSTIDLFTIWTIALLAMGFSATNPKKISFGKAFGTVFGVWFIYVIVKVGITVVFS
ncbi:MAG: YIP1 family protein [Candidatus Acidiferrales bacterium]